MDINTKTQSKIATQDAGLTTQTHRNLASETSFKEEMDKFTFEQNTSLTESMSDNVDFTENTLEKTSLNTHAQHNTAELLSGKTLNIEQTSFLTENTQKIQITKFNQPSFVEVNTPDIITDNSIKTSHLQNISNKKELTNHKVTKNTPNKKDLQNNKKITANNSLKENMTQEVSQVVNEVITNVTLNPINKNNILPQEPQTDEMQTLIIANQQLADIALMTETKISKAKITDIKKDNDSIKVDYSSVKMDKEDAIFFTDLIQDTEKTLQTIVSDLQTEAEQKIQKVAKNVKVSSTLLNALSEAVKTNQPMRIEFDKDVSIIIKIDKDGALNAKFIPGDKAVEEYLKQNILSLKQRFDEQEINYRDLSYSNRQKQNQENRKNKKENDHE